MANKLLEKFNSLSPEEKFQGTPKALIVLPLNKITLSYRDDKLAEQFGGENSYMTYTVEKIAGEDGTPERDSYGIHFRADFKSTIVNVNEEEVFINPYSSFYYEKEDGDLIRSSFENFTTRISEKHKNTGKGLNIIIYSGGSHTRINRLNDGANPFIIK